MTSPRPVRAMHAGPVTLGGTALLASAAGFGLISSPGTTIALGGGCALIAVVLMRPMWTVYLAIFLAVTTFPTAIPYSVPFGHASMFVYEPFLYFAAVYLVWKQRPGRAAAAAAIALLLLVSVSVARGYISGFDTQAGLIGDSRGMLATIAALLVGASLVGTQHTKAALATILWSLWVSAFFTVLSSATGLPLSGQALDAGLFINGSEETAAAVRLLTPSIHFALACLCACLALGVTRRVPVGRLAPYLVPALVITFLSFSRNSLIAVGVAVAVAVVADRSRRCVSGLLVMAGATGAVAVTIAALAALGVPGTEWTVHQASTFQERVIVGAFDSGVRSLDSSALARQVEDRYALVAIAEEPVAGHGFGYAYRPGYGPSGSFTATVGRFYVHNFYLWLLVKTGFIGLTLWVLLTGPPIVRQVLLPSTRGLMFAATTAGLLAICSVTPLPTGVDSSAAVTIGLSIGGLLAKDTRRSPLGNATAPSMTERSWAGLRAGG